MSAAARHSFEHYRDLLASLGWRPSSTRGQNFLLDPSLHRWIAECAVPTRNDLAVEVGAGLGFLTRELAARAGQVLAVEIDERLLAIARADLADSTNVEWLLGDVLGGPGGTWLPAIAQRTAALLPAGGRRLLVANLPYAISGPLLAEVATMAVPFDVCIVLIQKEMAGRVAAAPGTADYGGLTVLLQSVYSARSLRDVPPEVFRPRPKVVSAVLQLVRRPDLAADLVPAAARAEFATFVRHLFRQRRKVLRTSLAAAAAAIGGAVPNLSGEVLASRAEASSPAAILDFWRGCRGALGR